jgi:transcriptional regulator with XRE-family HTH domain
MNMSVGLRIKFAREQKNLTLEEVAKRCETTKQTIYKYENEIVTNIPYDKIVLLSKALDVTPSYLFGWEEKNPSEPQLTEVERLALELFRRIPEDKQSEALDLLRVALKMQQRP